MLDARGQHGERRRQTDSIISNYQLNHYQRKRIHKLDKRRNKEEDGHSKNREDTRCLSCARANGKAVVTVLGAIELDILRTTDETGQINYRNVID